MSLLLITIISVLASIMIADILPIVKEIKYRMNRKTLKPFDCNFCLSGWIALILSIVYYTSILQLVVCVFVVPFITALTYYVWMVIQKDLLRLKNK